jgi:hypothetical protein
MVAQRQSTLQTKPVSLKSVAKYDYKSVASDWTTAMQIRRQWDQDVILLGDQLYRQRDPSLPYLKVVGDDGVTNLATQITDPTLTFLVDKAVDNDCAGPVLFRFPADRNSAPTANLALAAQTVAFTFERNTEAGMDIDRRVAWNFNLFGWNAIEVTWLDPDDADEYLSGFPIMLTVHDPLSVAYELDGAQRLKRVIVAKQMLASQLPETWRAKVSAEDDEQVQVFEHFDRENFAAVVDDDIVDQYAHGATDIFGTPCVPFAIQLHDPKKIRLGDAPPQLSSSSPRELWVGSPAWMSLYKPITEMSYYRTALRFNVKENIFPWAIAEGDVDPDYASHTVQIPGIGLGKWSWAEVPNLLADINNAIQATDQQLQSGGMGTGLQTGQIPQQVSGQAVNAQTTFVKQRFEALRTSRMHLYRDVGLQILARVKSNTAPSTAQKYKAAQKKPLAVYGGAQDVSKLYTNGTPLPMSAVIQGLAADDPQADQIHAINALTFSGITHLDVSVESMEKMPIDQRMQLSMNLWNQKDAKLSDDFIYGELWGLADPEAMKARIAYQNIQSDPSLPLAQLAGLRAWARELAASPNIPPQQLQSLSQQMAQADTFELSVLQQRFSQLIGGGAAQNGQPPGGTPPPSSGQGGPPPPGQPNAAPGGPPPPGQPPPGPPPLSNPGGTPGMAPPQAPPPGQPPPPLMPTPAPPPMMGPPGLPMPMGGM